jgi:hypothetical protein
MSLLLRRRQVQHRLEHVGDALVGKLAVAEGEVGDHLPLDEQDRRHLGVARQLVARRTVLVLEDRQRQVAHRVTLAPPSGPLPSGRRKGT